MVPSGIAGFWPLLDPYRVLYRFEYFGDTPYLSIVNLWKFLSFRSLIAVSEHLYWVSRALLTVSPAPPVLNRTIHSSSTLHLFIIHSSSSSSTHPNPTPRAPMPKPARTSRRDPNSNPIMHAGGKQRQGGRRCKLHTYLPTLDKTVVRGAWRFCTFRRSGDLRVPGSGCDVGYGVWEMGTLTLCIFGVRSIYGVRGK